MTSASKTTTAARPRKHPIGGVDITKMRRPPSHPGELLRAEYFEPLGYGIQGAAADAMGMTRNRLNEIVQGKRPVTPESAVLLAALTGLSAQAWMHLQADYDLWHELQKTDTSHVTPLLELAKQREKKVG